ncbi:B2-adapt-app C and Adaptin N and Alpha adaptinC2 domain containing protein [Trichuris trichiura]|uniref:AP complex subunit beta n=1 Tax=Trichuris trichiura TaxID=36087 RepID=A0A077ZF94_TRITR|nr:B2-adapt-app C and Adaptin N and Alpha adaptinC2 domain containing protein [Trichuris trichiura]
MSDSKYFTTTKKGEIFELKSELNSDRKEKKKEAVKKVIASMTVGKDVSALFPDVVNCMQTDNLELKKLVYLYLMNYAKTQPDLAIMAVNTFVKDCEDPNPLIRALAVRTMGCIRVDKITEYLCDPLRKCLKDEDPYVRKTAAVCVVKLYDINAELVEDQGFLDQLKELMSDSNPMVVANAVAALTEINEMSPKPLWEMNSQTVNKLLTALNECTEWGQVFILDSLANYVPRDEREAQSMCERVLPRLAHANAAVVLSAIKVLMKLLEQVTTDGDFVAMLSKKMAPPLVTLLSAEPEIQYVALRNINLIVQKRPDILKHEMKVFFVKYNDPIYVKMEKLDIMIRLASQANIAQVLAELKEYATEVDVDFVRKSVRAIGRCAIKVEASAERCVQTLLDLIQTKVNYVVQEAIVVIKDIFRKYPNKYESIISTLCENLDTLDEPEAKASMIWIIGEYAERIDNADELLDSFLEGFGDENTQVQLQLLTAIVKLFLKRPSDTQELVQRVLSLATQDSDNPDLRDRGYIYWRLLSADPITAKEVVLAEKPLISEETDLLEPSLLDELISHIGTLASVYHKPPAVFLDSSFTTRKSVTAKETGAPEGAVKEVDLLDQSLDKPRVIPAQDSLIADLLNLDLSPPAESQYQANIPPAPVADLEDLLGLGVDGLLGSVEPPAASQPVPAAFGVQGLLGEIFAQPVTPIGYVAPKQVWLPASNGKGLELSGTFLRANQTVYMDLTITNRAMQPMSGFAIQFNKNSFGLTPAEPLEVRLPVQPGQNYDVRLKLATTGAVQKMDNLLELQVAVKNDIDIFYFACVVPINVLFTEDGQMDKRLFLQAWKDIPAENEVQFAVPNLKHFSPDDVCATLQRNNVFTVARRSVENQELLYHSLKLTNGIEVLSELKSQLNSPELTVFF